LPIDDRNGLIIGNHYKKCGFKIWLYDILL
jgi:hypothetical protein